jgi:hypothetical protein
MNVQKEVLARLQTRQVSHGLHYLEQGLISSTNSRIIPRSTRMALLSLSSPSASCNHLKIATIGPAEVWGTVYLQSCRLVVMPLSC